MKRIDSNPLVAVKIVVVIACVAVMAACGVSTSTVTDSVNSGTTTVPATEAPTTTEASTTTEVPTTTEEPATTEAPATTVGGSTNTLPAMAKDAFMGECVKGAGQSACDCIWSKIETQLSISDLMAAGSNGSLPPDIEKKIVDATTSCLGVTTG